MRTGSAPGPSSSSWPAPPRRCALALGPGRSTPPGRLLIAGIGLQHGALDHILHAHMHGDPEGPLRQSFALPYIAGIGVAWAAFETAPDGCSGCSFSSAPTTSACPTCGWTPCAAPRAGAGFPVRPRPWAGRDRPSHPRRMPWPCSIRSGGTWAGFGSDRHLPLQLASGVPPLRPPVAPDLAQRPAGGGQRPARLVRARSPAGLCAVLRPRPLPRGLLRGIQGAPECHPGLSSFYLKSLPLSVAFAAMAGIILWLAPTGS